MKNIFFISLAGVLLAITSCKSIVASMAGLRIPKVENKESVFQMLKKMHQDTNDVYTIDSSLFEKLKKEPFKPNWSKGFRPVQIRVYNNEGLPVMQWAICEGLLKDLKPFDSVPPRNINGLNTSLILQEDLSQYFTIDGLPAKIVVEKGFDYYIMVYFARYFPKWSKESFRQVRTYINNHKELKIKVYKINVDVQKFWNMELNVNSEVGIGGHK
jgi:hypothetical protein